MKDFYESNINTLLEIVNPFFAHKAIQMLVAILISVDPIFFLTLILRVEELGANKQK